MIFFIFELFLVFVYVFWREGGGFEKSVSVLNLLGGEVLLF